MAYVDGTGVVHYEDGDVVPLEVAVRDDDPQHIVEFIKQINPTISDGDDLIQAVAHVDEMRRQHRESLGKEENPHVATTLEEEEAPKEGTSETVEEKPDGLVSKARGTAG